MLFDKAFWHLKNNGQIFHRKSIYIGNIKIANIWIKPELVIVVGDGISCIVVAAEKIKVVSKVSFFNGICVADGGISSVIVYSIKYGGESLSSNIAKCVPLFVTRLPSSRLSKKLILKKSLYK